MKCRMHFISMVYFLTTTIKSYLYITGINAFEIFQKIYYYIFKNIHRIFPLSRKYV